MTRAGNLIVWAVLLAAAVLAFFAGALISAAMPSHAAFPGKNGGISFTTNRDGNLEIYTMGSDGSAQSRFTSSFQGNSNLPAYSPNGKRIAFTNDTSCFTGSPCPNPNQSIYWSNSITTFRVTDSDLAQNETEPAWYPGGRRIAYRSDQSGGGDIYYQALNKDLLPTGSPVRLTRSMFFDGQPAVSPGGKRIAFVSERDGDREIFVMNANAPEGRNNRPVKLTDNNVPDQMPDWSPNGAQIVFQRGPDSGPSEIFKMNSDGTHKTNLTKDPSTDLDPCFSPNGKKIAFDSDRDGDREIWRMDSDGSHLMNLTNNTGIVDANPSWQPVR